MPDEVQMPAKKLTRAERAWLDELSAVFAACPSARLGCYTTGDASLHFYDADAERAWSAAHGHPSMDAAQLHERAGSALASIRTAINIDSCAG